MSSTQEPVGVDSLDNTLYRVVVLMRLLGWIWLVALVVTVARQDADANSAVLAGAVVVGSLGAGLLLAAVRWRFLGAIWYVVVDGLVVMLLLAAAWIAGAQDFVAGGYPMSYMFVVAYASNLRWTFVASMAVSAWFAVLHVLMGLPPVRTVGSIQFIVVAVVAGWAFDSLRHREALRVQAQHELALQKEAAARFQERTEIARDLHDSVLQTLRLISDSADDPGEVRYLSRVQGRDLRKTINEYRSPHDDSFRARLQDAKASVEDRYRIHIEEVIQNDAEMTPRLSALVEAAREAMANAARHSGSATIDLFADVGSEGVQINVRDRGSGFSPESVPQSGIAHSIVGRLGEVGGTVSIDSAPSEGTDVSLFLPMNE